MRLFDRRKLPRDISDDLRATYPGKILAWAHGSDDANEQWLVGQAGQLVIGRRGDWTPIGWHDIARGGWDRDAGRLRWTGYDRSRWSILIDDPGDLLELFRERVQASIVMQQHVSVPNDSGDGIMIAARRNLDSKGDGVQWHVSLGRGTTWQTPGARETGEVMLERLRSEYERG